MKITLIGAGSYVFGGTALQDALVRHRMAGELALVDLNGEAAEAMAGVGRRMAREFDADCEVWATTDRRAALLGSDFVILSAAPQGASRWWMDYQILDAAGMPDQARECGGLGGLSYALRTISLALDVAEDMSALCPEAALLDVTNPMPRVVTALHRFTGIQAYGFCNVAQRGEHGYEWLAGLVDRAHSEIDVVTAGLNHFAWLVSIVDRETGADLMPVVKAAVMAGASAEMTVLRRWWDRYGALSVPGVDHAAEYLPTEPDLSYRVTPPYHGTAEERQARLESLKAAGRGELDWRDLFDHGSWEHPVDLAVAVEAKQDRDLPILNLPNAGYLPGLPDGRIVEVPAVVRACAMRGVAVDALPEAATEICARVSDVHEWVAEGAVTGNRDALVRAVEIDPAIADTAQAVAVLDQLVAAHRDLLPRFA
jgi:alpha-galactosidase/6-phospho-beta-glucosidase family protein